jgi:small subunit ribosomal protein S9
MEIIHTIGRRKTAVARVYMQPGSGNHTVNNKDYKQYFSTAILQTKINQPFKILNILDTYDVTVTVEGGGVTGQAEAVRLAISRALVKSNAENKPALKAKGLMTRDPRRVERKKPGQKKARKRFQFSKR